MYVFDNMIDLGLLPGQRWPSEAHRKVAQALGLCNPRVTSRNLLMAVVQAVIAIPKKEIKRVTFIDLHRYGLLGVVPPQEVKR